MEAATEMEKANAGTASFSVSERGLKMSTILLEKWKEVLAGTATVLVVVLQIIQLILSHDIDHQLAEKAEEMRKKAAVLQQVVEQTKTEVVQYQHEHSAPSPSH